VTSAAGSFSTPVTVPAAALPGRHTRRWRTGWCTWARSTATSTP
jgi:hypothetical protein